jgi:hypothetical protein
MSVPPTGTVTFLFTDIEGSTRLWERDSSAMQVALARHDEILRGTIEDHAGFVFKTVGDAFCCAFPTAPEALEAALDTYGALSAEEWRREIGLLRVRAALHTGAAEERGGDYFGPPLNRVARLLSAGHGGQVLPSLPTQELVRDQLPSGAGLQVLEEKRLLRQEEGPEGEPRFVMLEIIHEYATEKLEESGEAEEIKRAHAEFFLALAEEAEPELTGPDQASWFKRLEAEHDNVRVALSWAPGGGDAELGLRLLGALIFYWM